jgi:hypothetical protein
MAFSSGFISSTLPGSPFSDFQAHHLIATNVANRSDLLAELQSYSTRLRSITDYGLYGLRGLPRITRITVGLR